ncbi:MAG: PAS domain S-box protein [Thiotrichales bacterium]|nr:PAS domain S-box protein [Thiotrichales bacterium]
MFCSELKKQLGQQSQTLQSMKSVMNALDRVSAIIEFDLEGNILNANENFLQTVGYALSEIQGKHHRLFLFDADANSAEYQNFWPSIRKGAFISSRFKRRNKKGEVIWLEASYNPILDSAGQVVKVMKFATNITAQVQSEINAKAQIDAIHKVMAVIEFDPQGNILSANANFCKTMGYSLDEIQGKHHRMFADKKLAESASYQDFWTALRAGKACTGTYQRFAKGGREVWLEASYNPIKDCNGEVIKVIKYATDIGSNTNAKLLESVIKDASNIIDSIESGDLTVTMSNHLDTQNPTMYDKIIQQLSQSILNMNEKLKSVIGIAIDASHSVSHSASEVKISTQHLNHAIQEQAQALVDTNQSMQQVNNVIQDNTENAQQASSVAHEVQNQSREGVKIMVQTNAAMSQIEESSHKISDIVSLIDGIAFQTNLLALNAAVEAARAGEHGRGFAVVAGEVRSLAQKSAEAAKDIKRLIEETVSRVEQGSKLASQSGEMLQGISDSIGTVTAMIAKIAQASVEQAQGIQDVNHAISHIEQVSQQNAALIEETSAAAQSMSEQSALLREDMAFFKSGRPMQALRKL